MHRFLWIVFIFSLCGSTCFGLSGTTFNKLYSAIGTFRYVWLLYGYLYTQHNIYLLDETSSDIWRLISWKLKVWLIKTFSAVVELTGLSLPSQMSSSRLQLRPFQFITHYTFLIKYLTILCSRLCLSLPYDFLTIITYVFFRPTNRTVVLTIVSVIAGSPGNDGRVWNMLLLPVLFDHFLSSKSRYTPGTFNSFHLCSSFKNNSYV